MRMRATFGILHVSRATSDLITGLTEYSSVLDTIVLARRAVGFQLVALQRRVRRVLAPRYGFRVSALRDSDPRVQSR
ncbi:unnamed protein product [Zymoseptoria tritici ST99CH_1A5]|uniref:Uncharacterized protein n=1 Tax=Zymoseptoria tritici ST99CH_1A5 TaxID=1276529 RepID=A0A1Y6LWQ9_ZYMTR|nr:unnamed protein product [Zymoseptoria tritici ST99CH_1A5]